VQATVYSIYMQNIAQEVRDAQRSVVERFLPDGWSFEQREEQSNSHPDALMKCAAENERAITIFLDIDCIPIRKGALEVLAARAEVGMLCGAVQRANHLSNGEHLYVGPFCMAFSTKRYKQLGSPSFHENRFSDVGEQLTYAWQDADMPVYFLWPSHVSHPLWDLVSGHKFGLGTTYENLYYHEFCARMQQGSFLAKCQQVFEEKAMAANGH
jgi:hypothetical protein